MRESEYKLIKNGMDTYMYEQIKNLKTHNIITLKNAGCKSLDYQNEDYPWRQFQRGIWLYANYHTLRAALKPHNTALQRLWRYTRIKSLFDRHPLLGILKYSLICQHPWVMRGAKWASVNTQHVAVRMAHEKSLIDYEYMGSTYIRDIYDWDKIGRTSTGFD